MFQMRILTTFFTLAASAFVALTTAAAAGTTDRQTAFVLERAVNLRSSDTGWDYHSLDSARGLIFIAHRDDGLQVFDLKAGRLVKTLERSAGANNSALAPEFDLGIAGTTDGDVLVFRLSTLKTVGRTSSTTGGFDGAAYDPVSKRFLMVGEVDLATGKTPLQFFDGRSGRHIGDVLVLGGKVDAPRPDGRGNFFLPIRDRDLVIKVSGARMEMLASFSLSACARPSALEIDPASQRLFIGCRGKEGVKPSLSVLDAADGRGLANLPIGLGVDEVMFDPGAGLIVTANGDSANMTVIQQMSTDQYAVKMTIGTFPMARTGVLDPATGNIHLVTAQYIASQDDADSTVTRFLPNTFRVLTYRRQRAAQR